jgi:hypothetical protein
MRFVPPAERAAAEIAWQIGARRADVEATARFTAPGGRVSLAEWIVPAGVTVTDVNGPDVYSWSRLGPRLQVWMTKPAAEGVVHVSGTLARRTAAGRFDLPAVRPRAALTGGTLEVTTREGVSLPSAQTTNLSRQGADGRRLTFTIGESPNPTAVPYHAALLVEFEPGQAEAPLTTRSDQRPPAPISLPVRAELLDVEVARAEDGRWVRRATVWFTQSGPADLRIIWPTPVPVVAVAVDGQPLVPPVGPAEMIIVPLATTAGARQLQLIWTGDSPPEAPEMPALTANGEPVTANQTLWTIYAPPHRSAQSDKGPLPAAAAALVRAAVQVRLADPARATGPTASSSRTRALVEIKRADAGLADIGDLPVGPGGITLAKWRQQLREALQSGHPAAGLSATAQMPYDDLFVRGAPSTWRLSPGDDGPWVTWAAAHPEWPGQILRTAVLALMAIAAVWWGRRLADAWPEQMTLLGLGGWIAVGGVLWLFPAIVGVIARGTLLGSDLFRRRTVGSSHIDLAGDQDLN